MGCDCAKKKIKHDPVTKALESQLSVKEELVQALRAALIRVKADHDKLELELRSLKQQYGS